MSTVFLIIILGEMEALSKSSKKEVKKVLSRVKNVHFLLAAIKVLCFTQANLMAVSLLLEKVLLEHSLPLVALYQNFPPSQWANDQREKVHSLLNFP